MSIATCFGTAAICPMTFRRNAVWTPICSVVIGNELPKAGFEPHLLDVLRPQAHQRAAQRVHHALLNRGDLAGILGDVLAPGRGARLDKCRQRDRRRQALAELVVQVAGKGAPLVLLNLQQPRGQRRARRIRAGKILGEIVDGAGDMIELRGAEARQSQCIVTLLQLPQALNDRAGRHQRVADHEGGENGDAARRARSRPRQ